VDDKWLAGGVFGSAMSVDGNIDGFLEEGGHDLSRYFEDLKKPRNILFCFPTFSQRIHLNIYS